MQKGTESFGEVHFGQAQLGDKRRTARLVRTANLMCRRPGGTLPQKLNSPKDLRGAYRLFHCEEVTHRSILEPHQQVTFEKMASVGRPVLVLHDATELNYTAHRSLQQLGQIGSGHGRGYIAQNSLAVDPKTREAFGLCNQVLHRRAQVKKGETTAQKRKRKSRESLLWLQGTAGLPADWNIVDVCDQGADTFEFLEHEVGSGRRFVIRSAHSRSVYLGHESHETTPVLLRDHARSLESAGSWTLQVTSKSEMKSKRKKGKKRLVKRKKREATMAVSFGAVQIRPPKVKNGNFGTDSLPLWVVRVWEVNPPQRQERLEWFLLTNHKVHTFEDAYEVVSWYECRWIIEEYHKGLKTGCQIESPQFTCEDRLQPAIALISIVTLTLLSLRDAGRREDAKERKASEIISEDYIEILSAWRHGKVKMGWTIHDFVWAMARLGGHQNRKSDHPPGWQVLWRGWDDLQAMLLGADVVKQKLKKCGKT